MSRSRGGFTLVELIIATGLSTLVLVSIMALLTSLVRAQISSMRDTATQLALATAERQVEREMRQATLLVRPAAAATETELAGCANATIKPGDSAPSPIDPGQPMRGFAFCVAGGMLYYHASGSCPPSYSCGTGGLALAGSPSGTSQATASFSRPSARDGRIDVDLRVDGGGSSARARTTLAAALSPETLH